MRAASLAAKGSALAAHHTGSRSSKSIGTPTHQLKQRTFARRDERPGLAHALQQVSDKSFVSGFGQSAVYACSRTDLQGDADLLAIAGADPISQDVNSIAELE